MAKDNSGSIMVAFVIGALTGAAVALLFAPATGEETREFIGQKARESKAKAREAFGVDDFLGGSCRDGGDSEGTIAERHHRVPYVIRRHGAPLVPTPHGWSRAAGRRAMAPSPPNQGHLRRAHDLSPLLHRTAPAAEAPLPPPAKKKIGTSPARNER